MPANASPTKKRAALAPRDANANPSLSSPNVLKDGKISVLPSPAGASLFQKRVVPATARGTKRPAEDACWPGNKKKCVQENTRPHRSRTSSPSTSSIFDTSAAEGDASWTTTTTEPDRAVAGATDAPILMVPRPRGNMTREQAREKAEILRLRLGLACYKLRTGQTGVPLADLQRKPLPPRPSVRVQSTIQVAQDATKKKQNSESQDSHPSSTSTSTSTSTRLTDSNRPEQGGTINEPQSCCRATSSEH
ncbi:hypothetical protein E4U54_005749 [Claviceps lovelessii]|nr:hypothetical protein E4U54_005749 [Claviceps lovelessii]